MDNVIIPQATSIVRWVEREQKVIAAIGIDFEQSVLFNLMTFNMGALESEQGNVQLRKLLSPSATQALVIRLEALAVEVEVVAAMCGTHSMVENAQEVYWAALHTYNHIPLESIRLYRDRYPYLWLIPLITKVYESTQK